jgi:CheY-like chemotaxis protein
MDRPRLLLVEDERAIREFVRELFEEAGYETLTANNGREAVAALGERAFDLVVSDLRMPEMDGLQLLAALKEKVDKNMAPVGAVLVTGCNDTALAVQGMQLGALNYILKPFDPPSLLASIASALEQSREMAKSWRRDQEIQQVVKLQRVQLARLSGESGRSGPVAPLVRHPVVRAKAHEAGPKPKDAAPIPDGSTFPPRDPAGDAENLSSGFDIPVKIQFDDAEGPHRDATICRVNAGFLVLVSSVSMDRGRRLGVFYQGRRMDSEVVYCRQQPNSSFRVGVYNPGRAIWKFQNRAANPDAYGGDSNSGGAKYACCGDNHGHLH